LEKEGSPASKLRRTLREELGLEVALREETFRVEHGYSHFFITVHVFEGTLQKGLGGKKGLPQLKWVHPGRHPGPALSGLERKILRKWLTPCDGSKRFADGKTPAKGVK
jgi:hypothetical protein